MNLAIQTRDLRITPDIPKPNLLEIAVRETLARHTEFQPHQISTQANRVKYEAHGVAVDNRAHLTEVFQLMRNLNESGLSNTNLGRTRGGGRCLRDALEETCIEIARLNQGRPLIYVELGPEPVKTSFIIEKLQSLGVAIERYIAVDINPMSAGYMEKALRPLLPATPREFVTASFQSFSLSDAIGATAVPALVTMLGFQEGNDYPSTAIEWMASIARPGDLFMSESQLYHLDNVGRIPEFYRIPMMQRFSRLAFEQGVSRNIPSLSRFFLLPARIARNEVASVAIMAEEFVTKPGNRQLFVTNFCLKFTKDQYNSYRTRSGAFELLSTRATDDETIAFQLSRRTVRGAA